ncbi:MAG TPA: glycosyltransferase family 4 protein [Candidatus Udaeobacter sp.]|nr:glycosyltransferase family 4 protein [Candidatus Udaeobacter sp.]
MRIAQVAPLIESVPPKHYGGTERIVSYLTEELVRAGHQVTLFASGDSVTTARLIAPCERSLRKNERCKDPVAREVLLIDHVVEHIDEFDLVHFHTGYLHFPICRYLPVPHVTTLHGRLDTADLVPVFDRFRDEPLISISNAQRKPLAWANWQATVYHGLPVDQFQSRPRPGEYLAFLGRISPEKRADRAIEIAKRAGMRLKIAAKIDKADRRYFKKVIEPLLREPHVEWVGEITDRDKDQFLGNAYALLFPIDWPEPFGLVMIEAMGCGTPVIAYDSGSVPEVMEDGVTGFIVHDLDSAVKAVERVRDLDRARCREVFERRFAAKRMANDYIDAYTRLMNNHVMKSRKISTSALSVVPTIEPSSTGDAVEAPLAI